MWTREQIVYMNEKRELIEEQMRELGSERSVPFSGKWVESVEDALLDVIRIEAYAVCEDYNIDPLTAGTAFPHLADLETFEDSVEDYCHELASDITQLYDIPAIEVVDQLETWLSDLCEHHDAKK